MADGTWISDGDMNGAYGPDGGLGAVATYADTNAVLAYPGRVMTGIGFYFAGNRLMPQIQSALPGEAGVWQPRSYFNPQNFDFIPSNLPASGCSGIGDSGSCTMYVDTTSIFAPPGQVAIGAALTLAIDNRVAPALLCARAADLSGPGWIYNTVNNGNFFEGGTNLGDYYVDTNQVAAAAGWVVTGIALYQKGNRIAPQLYVTPWSGLQA